ncbi:MAG TPA: DNA replication/repair protein RecF [Clostridiales bacterium]|nr:DNA replication/repair protein RecF [Clostridiales bacterium]
MKVKKIELLNYRNIHSCIYEPSENVNVIYGENALGKTNLLESIWMFTGLKSFRSARNVSFIKFGEEFARNEMLFENNQREMKAAILFSKTKEALLNGVKLDTVSDLIGEFNAVIFTPNHLSFVKGSPKERRDFLDSLICRVYPAYTKILSEYNRVLVQRNCLLKNRNSAYFLDTLDILDKKAAIAARKVCDIRYKYIDELFQKAALVYDGISSGREKLNLRYVSVMPKCFSGNTYEELFCISRSEDIESGTTKYGPHRDDIEIIIDGKNARLYGSQGQQRSVALSLKLAEAQIIENESGEKPVILLDDVMSELDEGRQRFILDKLKDVQVFITCCVPDKRNFSDADVRIITDLVGK